MHHSLLVVREPLDPFPCSSRCCQHSSTSLAFCSHPLASRSALPASLQACHQQTRYLMTPGEHVICVAACMLRSIGMCQAWVVSSATMISQALKSRPTQQLLWLGGPMAEANPSAVHAKHNGPAVDNLVCSCSQGLSVACRTCRALGCRWLSKSVSHGARVLHSAF